jgi:hypothetical protein
MSSPAGWHTDPNDPRVQRYWDGSAWTGQRIWDGAKWVDAAAPLGQRISGRWWWLGGAMLAAIAVGSILAATVGGSHKAAGASDPGGSVPTTTVHATAGSGQAMRAWEARKSTQFVLAGGHSNAQAIIVAERDVAAIGKDYSDSADQTTLEHDCFQLRQDVGIPDDSPNNTVNGNLSKASEYLVSGSTDCGADDQAASAELNKAIDYLNAAISEIKSLGG